MLIASSGPPIAAALYYLSAGFLLFAAAQCAVVGLAGHRKRLYLTFGLICLMAAAFQVATVAAYQATTFAGALRAFRWQGTIAVLVQLPFVVFTELFTRRRMSRWTMAGLAGVLGGLLMYHLASPYGMRWTEAALALPTRLPWGEQLTRVVGVPSAANAVLRVVGMVITVWALWCAKRMYEAGDRRGALLFAGFLVLQAAATTWGALIDLGRVDGPYLPGFAFIALTVSISLGLGMDLRDRTRDLAATADRLNEEVDLRRSAELHIRRLAYEDELTGLANRAQLVEHLSAALVEAGASGRGGGMILIDLHHFKTINVALTHEVGDEVLREVAARIRRVVGPDAFAARLGGDEFVVVLSGLPEDRAAADERLRSVAEGILARLVGSMHIGARILEIGARAGVVRFPQDAATEGDILRRADMALSHAKGLGLNSVQFYLQSMQAAADGRMELERGLRGALANGQLQLRYQPQVAASGRVVGAEVLLRWRHPELGDIGPARFIPVAEETGLIHELGDWVLETACERLAEWTRAEVSFSGHLSVNVSGWQLIRPGFVERVERTLERYQIPPHRLTLEVTESTFLYHLDEAAAQLQALRDSGIRIALDDFGTGYSSLAYLQHLPLDELKVDRAFVRQVHAAEPNPLVESIIAVARNLRLEVVAEGVELESQRRALSSAGCEIFQGYLFARPMPEDELLEWLGAHSAAAPQLNG